MSSAPFMPEQDIATALAAAGAVWGGSTVGGTFALVKNTNLMAGEPRSSYEPGNAGFNPGVWIDTSSVPAPPAQPMTNAGQSGSWFWAGIRLWAITYTEQSGVDVKAQGYLIARQLRDYFHTKVYSGSSILGTYIMATSKDPGDVRIRKFTDARQYQFYTDLLLQWWNVN